jgi:hypothetical protein
VLLSGAGSCGSAAAPAHSLTHRVSPSVECCPAKAVRRLPLRTASRAGITSSGRLASAAARRTRTERFRVRETILEVGTHRSRPPRPAAAAGRAPDLACRDRGVGGRRTASHRQRGAPRRHLPPRSRARGGRRARRRCCCRTDRRCGARLGRSPPVGLPSRVGPCRQDLDDPYCRLRDGLGMVHRDGGRVRVRAVRPLQRPDRVDRSAHSSVGSPTLEPQALSPIDMRARFRP